MAKRRKRNYKAEYKRRLARAKKLGYSKTIARGHARVGEVGIKRAKELGIKPVVIIRKKSRKGFRHTTRTRKRDLKKRGITFEIDVTDQDEFIATLLNAGFTERESYTLWFS